MRANGPFLTVEIWNFLGHWEFGHWSLASRGNHAIKPRRPFDLGHRPLADSPIHRLGGYETSCSHVIFHTSPATRPPSGSAGSSGSGKFQKNDFSTRRLPEKAPSSRDFRFKNVLCASRARSPFNPPIHPIGPIRPITSRPPPPYSLQTGGLQPGSRVRPPRPCQSTCG
jgi:hypothetical protein